MVQGEDGAPSLCPMYLPTPVQSFSPLIQETWLVKRHSPRHEWNLNYSPPRTHIDHENLSTCTLSKWISNPTTNRPQVAGRRTLVSLLSCAQSCRCAISDHLLQNWKQNFGVCTLKLPLPKMSAPAIRQPTNPQAPQAINFIVVWQGGNKICTWLPGVVSLPASS